MLQGRATFTLDDETLDAPAGTVVFVRDPKVKRHARRRSRTPRCSPSAVRAAARTSRRRGRTTSRPSAIALRATTTRTSQSSRTRSTPPRPSGDALQPRMRRGARGAARRRARAPAAGARAQAGVDGDGGEGRRPRVASRAPRLAGLTAVSADPGRNGLSSTRRGARPAECPPQEGVTRYASNTASRFLSAVSRLRSSFTSPTSAVYQFRAMPSSTTPP